MSMAQPGQSVLPAARVSKIIKTDKDIAMLSKEAIFLISKATEQFLKKLTDSAYTEARMGQRKGIQYKDLSNAIQHNDAFFYLQEVIPPPIPVEKAKKARKQKLAVDAGQLSDEDEEDSLVVLPTETQTQDTDMSSQTDPPASVPVETRTLSSQTRPTSNLAHLMNPEPETETGTFEDAPFPESATPK